MGLTAACLSMTLPQVINETLAGMQGLVEGMSSAVNGQLDWVVAQLGGANRGLRLGHSGGSTCTGLTPKFSPLSRMYYL